MIRKKIVRKLGLTLIVVFSIILISLGMVIDYIFSNFYKDHMKTNLEELSLHYVEMIQTHGGMMSNMLDMMAEMSNIDVVVFDDEGKGVARTMNFDPPELNVLTEQNMSRLSAGQSIQFQVMNDQEERFLAIAQPVFGTTSFLGAVLLFSSIEAVEETVQQIRYLLLLAGIGGLLIAAGLTYILSRRISIPLLAMEHATKRMAEGNFETRVDVFTQDEIGSLAKSINLLASELKRYRDTRSEFFANISHELRTPITYLEGYSKVLADGIYHTDEEKNKVLEIIHQEAGRLKNLVEDLFELSKMEEGKVSLTMEWMDLSEPLKSAMEKTKPKVKEKGLELESHVEANLPYTFADGMRMEQIFINLLDNAIRYTEEGFITVRIYSMTAEIMIEISDTGPGIPEEDQPYIFERFYRVEKSRSRELGGTGLGLSIVKTLVDLQGGSIAVKSAAGAGTTFILSFPIKEEVD